ncbi:MAG: beta-ketoacyl-[acyl-carrier-protein] synthase family protein [Betaproteobacteria bacterium]|nr:beta-ketoacyl-[acyl-carrier-protein] synthase family protein [Betaproteobacteria bacterium]
MSDKRDVVITGLGVISPIGCDIGELISYLSTARSGIRLCEPRYLQKTFPAGVVPRSFANEFTKLELPFLDRCPQMAIIAARQAVTDAGLGDFSCYEQRAGLFYGTVRGGAETEQASYEQILIEHKNARPFTMMSMMHNAGAAQISIRHKILGPVLTHSEACASSGTAIGEALRAIRDGYLDVAVAGGAEAPLTAAMFWGFDATRALAMPDESEVGRSCRPFSKDRAGLVLGEGAAFVVLESAEHAQRRGAACYAVLSGYGVASDGYHIASPKLEGEAKAMRLALEDAGIGPADIHYINAHGTATRGGDTVEAQAINLAFGDAGRTVPVSSTKSVHGHLLGAASALEFVVTVLAIAESFLPATAHLDEIDPLCELNHVANSPIFDRRIERAMSFSSGFGGTNVALVISKHREMPAKRPSVSVSSS